MTKLSGKVAILDDAGEVVIATKDLGDTPVEVKDEVVKPLEENFSDLSEGEQHTAPVYDVQAEKVVADYGKEDIPPEPPSLEDQIADLDARVTVLEAKTK